MCSPFVDEFDADITYVQCSQFTGNGDVRRAGVGIRIALINALKLALESK